MPPVSHRQYFLLLVREPPVSHCQYSLFLACRPPVSRPKFSLPLAFRLPVSQAWYSLLLARRSPVSQPWQPLLLARRPPLCQSKHTLLLTCRPPVNQPICTLFLPYRPPSTQASMHFPSCTMVIPQYPTYVHTLPVMVSTKGENKSHSVQTNEWLWCTHTHLCSCQYSMEQKPRNDWTLTQGIISAHFSLGLSRPVSIEWLDISIRTQTYLCLCNTLD